MTLKIYMDKPETLELTEEHGVAIRMVRRFRVLGTEAADYRVLFEAMAAEGVPTADGSPASLPELGGAPNLILVGRSVRSATQDDKIAWDVDLTYGPIPNEGQNLNFPPTGVVLGKASASLNQVTTNLDRDGNEVTLEHTYGPIEDPMTHELKPDPDFNGDRAHQIMGGQMNVLVPQRELRYSGILQTPFPWFISAGLVGAVNDNFWSGGAPGEWMCMEAPWEPYGTGTPNTFRFSFAFQHNKDGWDPQIIFIDQRTSKPPANLVEGVGYKTVPYYRRTNFELMMGVRVQGG